MYIGESKAIAFLDSVEYWDRVKRWQVYVGVGVPNAWGHTSRSGWCETSLHIQPIYTIKDDDICDDPHRGGYDDCDCYPIPNDRWSLPEMTEAELSRFIRNEQTSRWPGTDSEYGTESPDFARFLDWWGEAGQRNDLMKEVPRGPAQR